MLFVRFNKHESGGFCNTKFGSYISTEGMFDPRNYKNFLC